MSSFCSAKATHIFSAKNIRILYIDSAKTVNEMTLIELVKLTTIEQLALKKSKLDLSKYLLSLSEDGPEEFMRKVLTPDETLVYHFDPGAKKHSMQWKHPGSPIL